MGLRPTRQRALLGWLLFGKGNRHVTADQLLEEAMMARIPVSHATIYNTLHQFRDVGLIRKFAMEGSKTYFDTNLTEHHHYYLEEVGSIMDMPAEGTRVTNLPPPPVGLEVASVEVIVRLRRARR
jgi:Fur family transcriptional regulator, iron response regulator